MMLKDKRAFLKMELQSNAAGSRSGPVATGAGA